jgi:hypothetical protein
MNSQEALDAIAALVADHERGAVAHQTDPDPLAVNIRTLLDRCAAARAGKPSDRDVLLDAADALRFAGEALFNATGVALGITRRTWKTEDRVREHFGLPNPDAAPATPDPE